MLLSITVLPQQRLELCDYDLTKTYKLNTLDNIEDINIQPYTNFQVDDKTVYVTYHNIGTYVITATFSNGLCYKEDKFIINVIECLETRIWVPSAFTPNGDNVNDEFGAYGINISNYSLLIYDRWGLLVFQSNNLTYRWNGYTKNNTTILMDTYAYVIKYRDNKGKWGELIGRVTLTL